MGKALEPLLIYLHGFNSSPQSFKAQYLYNYFSARNQARRIIIPSLPFSPADSISVIKNHIENNNKRRVVIVGSSLGGYYATFLADFYDLQAVLLNPAAFPYELMDSYLGENRNFYTGEVNILDLEHIEQLREIKVDRVKKPENYLLMVQTGDEVLDFKQATKFFYDSPNIIQYGGSHQFEQFETVVPAMINFLNMDL